MEFKYAEVNNEYMSLSENIKKFRDGANEASEYTWLSEDNKTVLVINKSGYCEQSGFFELMTDRISITFPHQFSNTDFGFFLESTIFPIKNLTKSTTGVSFVIENLRSKYMPKNVRWLAVGMCG